MTNTSSASENANRIGVAILARAPVAGEAKTRLIPALGAENAARLQAWMLHRTVDTALRADIGPVSLWCAGNEAHADFECYRGHPAVQVRKQVLGGLGERMLASIAQTPTPDGTLVIGTDCPALEVGHLRQAAISLREHDVVLIPAEDGGYVLIGMNSPRRELFSAVDWGSGRVMAQTRQRLSASDLDWIELPALWDVDRPEDLTRLMEAHPELGDPSAADQMLV